MITKTAMEEKLPSLQRYIDAVLTMTAVLRVEVGGEEVVAGAEILVDGQIRQQVKRCLADFFAPWDTDIETHSILVMNFEKGLTRLHLIHLFTQLTDE